jgi:16S rRNA (uracil1498-N3)-methyltransferase
VQCAENVQVTHRLYVSTPLAANQALTLDRERAHYLTRVLRLRRDEPLICFDGRGHAWQASLLEATARSAVLAVGALIADEPPPYPQLHLAQGLLKGAAMDQVVQKSTELGATDVWLIRAERSNAALDQERAARKQGHWRRVMESAAEQCGALHLPRLHDVRSLREFLADPPAAILLMLDPGGAPLPLQMPRESLALLVGPEGGWSDAEREAAVVADVARYGLGTRVLRAETAPLAALAALRHGWGWN